MPQNRELNNQCVEMGGEFRLEADKRHAHQFESESRPPEKRVCKGVAQCSKATPMALSQENGLSNAAPSSTQAGATDAAKLVALTSDATIKAN